MTPRYSENNGRPLCRRGARGASKGWGVGCGGCLRRHQRTLRQHSTSQSSSLSTWLPLPLLAAHCCFCCLVRAPSSPCPALGFLSSDIFCRGSQQQRTAPQRERERERERKREKEARQKASVRSRRREQTILRSSLTAITKPRGKGLNWGTYCCQICEYATDTASERIITCARSDCNARAEPASAANDMTKSAAP